MRLPKEGDIWQRDGLLRQVVHVHSDVVVWRRPGSIGLPNHCYWQSWRKWQSKAARKRA